jgi:UDP-N-acetylglucosamine--N-acetylmuramyl-(pentapeptide) pyrophosphoryl-undecaprenol N-acetylglucosamine transferase
MSEEKNLQCVLIMAGGTGGHIFPGLALAHYFKKQNIDVQWLGTTKGMESKLIPENNIPFHSITIQGLRGKGFLPLLLAPFKIIKAIYQAKRIMNQVKPNVVIGFGGFASGPGGVAAWMSRHPLIIHEQNAKAGLTNIILSRLAKRVLEGFPDTFLSQPKVVPTGNPIREEIENNLPPNARLQNSSKLKLLVLGGSLGAKALNEVVPKALALLPENERPDVWHQTGEKHYTDTKNLYDQFHIPADLFPFIHDMARSYSWADMVLCRAGALTVTELCTVGVGAILVPYPYAVDDHQTANANYMVKNGAAICIQQSQLTENDLAQLIKQFAQSPDQRLTMANAAYQLRKVNVVNKIFEICKEICR